MNNDQYANSYLSRTTYVMDCECYTINEHVIYREISLCCLQTEEVYSFKVYDESIPDYYDLYEKQKKTIQYQYNCHGLC